MEVRWTSAGHCNYTPTGLQDKLLSAAAGAIAQSRRRSCCMFDEVTVSGGASAVKESGHFEVRTSSSLFTRMHFFPQKSWRAFSSFRPQNTAGCQRLFTVKIKQIKRSEDMVTILFSVHTITEAKQYPGLGRAEPGRWIFQPGYLTWRALV